MRWTVPLVGFVVAACGADPITRYICPPLVEYSTDRQARLAAEVRAAPADAEWPDFIVDYGALRERCRGIGDG